MALITTPIIETLVPYFKRDYWSNACVMCPGHYNNPTYSVTRAPGRIRATIRFQENDYDHIQRLAYALSITPHATATLLFETALQSASLVNAYVSNCCCHMLNERRLKVLKNVCRELNQAEEEVSFAALISAIVDNAKTAGKSASTQLKDKLTKWLDFND